MNALVSLVRSPLAGTLGWTLFHSLWQGAVAGLLLLAVLVVCRPPRVRYACACLALAGVLTGFGITFWRVMPQGPGAHWMAPNAAPQAVPEAGAAAPAPARDRMAEILPWLAPFWMAGVILFHLRTAGSWMAVRRLRRQGVCRAPQLWQQRLDTLRRRLQLTRPVELLESALAGVPVAAGYLRPVILVPLGLLAGMPAAQVETILLHELAHIRRGDYLVNLLQTAVEGFLFYHPAVWWISRVARAEREHCCDDLAVAASGDAQLDAAALAALEESRGPAHQAVLAANRGSLVKRIQRLLYPSKGSPLAPLFSALILAIAVAAVLGAWQAGSAAPSAAQSGVSPYTKWLQEDVVYIIDDRERTAFLALKTNAERDHFIEQFWLRRDPTPGTPENEFKTEHYRRMAYANTRFASNSAPGWKTDRGRIYIQFGPPDEMESHTAGAYPVESWMYHDMKDIGKNVIMDFADTQKTGDFRMTSDPNPGGAIKKVP